MTDALAIIDIEALSSPDAAERRRVASEVGRACRDLGFFAIRGHGVADGVVDRAFAASREFFALPDEVKQSLAVGARGHHRGYVGSVEEAPRAKPDPHFKEAFSLIWTDETRRPPNVWPPIAGWRETVQSCFDSLLGVGRALHRAFALDLGLDERFFDDKIDRPLATLRMFRYPAAWGAPTTTTPVTPSSGIHTDYGNLTLLAAGDVGRLQVRRRDGHWIEVPALEGAFVCNVGDCLMRWSNDVYVSTPHRVLPPQRERYSIVLFVDANPDAIVSALPGCVPTGTVARYAPISAADHLGQRFAATYGG